MDKYIDADLMALNESEAFMSAQAKIEDPILFGLNSVVHSKIQKLIAETPAVDAVEVVRCRDCKHWVKFESSLIGEVKCCTGQGSVNIQKEPDDFCSYGERKDGYGNE